jgi:hypothetical protein
MEYSNVNKIISSPAVVESIRDLVGSNKRFRFIESLRIAALASYEGLHSVTSEQLQYKSIQSRAMQAQFELLDNALFKLLRKEGRESVYLNFQRSDDPDLPDDPSTLSDPVVAYRYALKRLYRRQFDITVDEQKDGGWPLLTFDLLQPIDGSRTLLVQQLPAAVEQHNSPDFLNALTLPQLREAKATLLLVQADLARRLQQSTMIALAPKMYGDISAKGKVGTIIKIVRDLIDWAGRLEIVLETVKAAKEAWEKADRERKEAEKKRHEKEYRDSWGSLGGEPRAIPGASDHVDSFERNGEQIGRTC